MKPIISAYPMAFDRADARVTSADILKAIELFTGSNGRPPAALYLHPTNIKRLEGQLPDIQIIESAGILLWELGLSSDGDNDYRRSPASIPKDDETTPDVKATLPDHETPQSPVLPLVTDYPTQSTAIKPPYHKNSQLTLYDPIIEQVIQDALANEKTTRDRSSRTIARLLKSRGIQVSHMTVNRRMKSLIHEKHR